MKSEPTGQTDASTDSTENTTDQIKDGKQEVGQPTTTKPTGQRKQQVSINFRFELSKLKISYYNSQILISIR